jgi:hypothetical protein
MYITCTVYAYGTHFVDSFHYTFMKQCCQHYDNMMSFIGIQRRKGEFLVQFPH